MRRAAKSPRIAGLDLSLSRPAVCIIPEAWEHGDWASLEVASFPTEGIVEDPKTVEGAIRRISYVVERVHGFVVGTNHLYVENYAFSQSSTSTTKLAELGGAMRWAFWATGTNNKRVLQPVTASQGRKLLWGTQKLPRKGAKQLVQEALKNAGAPFENDDEADAFVVANFGLCALGYTYLTLA